MRDLILQLSKSSIYSTKPSLYPGCRRVSLIKYGPMNDTSSDDILLLKQRLAEQEELIHALQEKLRTGSVK
ncbi:hypothetical protein, partial [Klebsiella michiganensis]